MSQEPIAGATGTVNGSGQLTTYNVPGSVIITPYSVSVQIDGSGASGNFLPCLSFYSQTGQLIARCPAPQVTAGASVEASWFPHVAAPAAASGGGIQYDVDNEGDWLYVGTTGTGAGSPFGRPIVFYDFEGGGVFLRSGGSDVSTPGASLDVADGEIQLRTFTPDGDAINWDIGSGANLVGTSSSAWIFENDGTGGVQINSAGSLQLKSGSSTQIVGSTLGTSLGFFGHAPSPQVATPVTLADVIALLQAYGLAA